MKKIIKPIITTALFTHLLLHSYLSYALENDSDEPMFIQSDAAQFNNSTGFGEYMGNVVMDQGTTHITADHATTANNDDGDLVEATAQGDADEQAHYWTRTELDKPIFHAYADRMEFKAQEDKIYLYGDAQITQGDDSYSAPVIEYDIAADEVVSPGNQEGGRTTIIIHPGQNNSQSDS